MVHSRLALVRMKYVRISGVVVVGPEKMRELLVFFTEFFQTRHLRGR